ncbi:MAG TPA: hypothetical protein VJA94_25055 [Candidatus Angelobacter sp.]
MNQHPYLRAYMAGIAFPTVILLIWLTGFCIARFALGISAPIEQLLVFPMAVVPNVFGAWNMLFVKLHQHWRVPIGLYGAALPFFLGPIGAVFVISMGFLKITETGLIYFDIFRVPYWYLSIAPLLFIAVYYLIWKYIVGSLNKLLGIAY